MDVTLFDFADIDLQAENCSSMAAGCVQIWKTDLDPPGGLPSWMLDVLSPDEERRAQAYRFAQDRKRFVVSRAMTRAILAAYTGCTPTLLRFSIGSHGKPHLEDFRDIQFNVSHSHNLGLVAVTLKAAIGIDVEAFRVVPEVDKLAATVFSPIELSVFRSLPQTQRDLAFLHAWTRKEAFVKAHGQGLSYPLDQIDVSLRPHEPARILAIGGSFEEATRWEMQNLPRFAGYVAAVVTGDTKEGSDR